MKIAKTFKKQTQFFSTIERIDTSNKVDTIRENLNKQKNKNIKEYGESIIEYLESIMQEENLYVRKNYFIITSNDKLFYITILFRINAKSLEELDEKSNLLKSEFAKISAKARTLNFRQLDGLKANLPFNNLKIYDYERNVTTNGLATMFPIANSNNESSIDGVPIGRNYFTGLPVYLDTFDKSLTNPHIVIMGVTGFRCSKNDKR